MYISTDIGVTSCGNYNTAKELIDAIAEARANCAKFQIIRPNKLSPLMQGNHLYQTADGPQEENTKTMLERLAFESHEYLTLAEYAKGLGLDVAATVDFVEDVSLAESMQVKYHKICRGTWKSFPHKHELISEMLGTRKEVVIDTDHVQWCTDIPNLPQITMQYFPQSTYTDIDIRNSIGWLSNNFTKVGYSACNDSIDDIKTAIYAGASMVEVILTLDKTQLGPDHIDGFEPDKLKKLVEVIKCPMN